MGAVEIVAVIFPFIVAPETMGDPKQIPVVVEINRMEIVLRIVALGGLKIPQFEVVAVERKLVVADLDGGFFAGPVALVEGDGLGGHLITLSGSNGLRGNLVGFVPLADVDVNVPTHVEVIDHDVAVVVVPYHHRRNHFLKESQRLAAEVLLVVIGVDANVVLDRLETLGLIGIRRANLVAIGDKIDGTGGDVQNEAAVVTNADAGLDAVLLANRLDGGGQFGLLGLAHVCHIDNSQMVGQRPENVGSESLPTKK